MNNNATWVIVAIVAIIVFAWVSRYEISTGQTFAMRLDKWTGQVVQCPGERC